MPGGRYEIAWAADDGPDPPAGCRFDLVLDDDRLEPEGVRDQIAQPIPKLAYETTGAGGTIRGRTTLHLPAQTYQFQVEGTCAWTVSIVDA